jgi:site-specific recombinase XerD
MASLYKKPVVVTDPVTGVRTKTKSKKWWGRYRDEHGFDKRVPLANDKTASLAMLNEIVLKTERKSAGIDDPFDSHRHRKIADHVQDFEKYLKDKGSTPGHVALTIRRIKKVIAGCKFTRIDALIAGRVHSYLAGIRQTGKGIATSNHYLRAIKMFSRWLVRDRRAADDPLISLSLMNAKVDPRHERRTLGTHEIALLIRAATNGRPFRTLHGRDRSMIYLMALSTGLRAKELASLTPASFRLDGDSATVTVTAAYSKRRRKDVLPLRADVASAFRTYLSERGLSANDRLWPGTWTKKASAKMIRIDLEAAGIPYVDEQNRVFDFHALRHQFISDLARSGAHPKEAQVLARHSTITLTMDCYTHLGIVDLHSALSRLPDFASSIPGKEVPKTAVSR